MHEKHYLFKEDRRKQRILIQNAHKNKAGWDSILNTEKIPNVQRHSFFLVEVNIIQVMFCYKEQGSSPWRTIDN